MEIGVDIVKHARVKLKLAKRILTENEQQQFNNLKTTILKKEYLASRFAAKEAIIKATNNKYGYQGIEVLRTESNPKVNIDNIKLSLSHEKDYSVAFCIYFNN